ncbi:MAG: adenylate/guanylate cyclase domain-containing protein [Zetaproteobacteria bacterium CG_4_9_14_3_um_filter_49_83]|nr:MAG: adenylate/guanylate cyclase domain-containing protein [Zetaproteobacteria bacterium CG02_land_8_20_14_3_00_50_9]PIY55336.1 MAG: adenylate/guanylate cyclase domain-containing protein [Zetaproteobacteria bacterium CG_4_10_14_0_8_um_filter_49_80]PJA34499.1 MAG: adenylate/guanylate cyclase domain-containing protein [Zetaproteobacteria bacterium CG_4_9_14_3_um_filter_49_83]
MAESDQNSTNVPPHYVIQPQKQVQHLEMLLNITRTVAGMETVDEVLHALLEMTMRETLATRGSIFLHDERTGELYSRISKGNLTREIRMLDSKGIAGKVFHSGEGMIIHNAYASEFFNREIDESTGFITKNILCAPIRTVRGEIIGVAQMLNKVKGRFCKKDLTLLEIMTSQAAITLQNRQFVEHARKEHDRELEFLDLVSDITAELDLGVLLQRVMREATRMLNADRSTLFLNDDSTNELWSQVGEGLNAVQIRFPSHLGIAGSVYTSGKSMNIPYAYADLRFNPAFDKQTGYFTRSILCVPVVNKKGKVIGVTQSLNKKGGPFNDEDESRLRAFTSQIAIALENAKLFNSVQDIKNYNESMLESMSNGVMTLDEKGKIVTCNAAGLRILRLGESAVINHAAQDFFANSNVWILDKIKRVEETGVIDMATDVALHFDGDAISANLSILPLVSHEGKKLGTMLMIEDISSEKRMRATITKHMDPGVADQLLAGGDDILGGRSTKATVLFSDIRSFTTLTEELGAQGTVHLLNEYFTLMVECIQDEGGMLDKFIGDAIMAAFGVPVAHDDDEDRALRCAIRMQTDLRSWNERRAMEGKQAVDIGIGLNTDTIVTGNIGSPKRMDYTMIGDGVNLASRLESACKQYASRILISENTRKLLKGIYRIRDIDMVVVKGKTEPVRIFEVLDYHTEASFPNLMDAVNQFNDGVVKYRKKQWPLAIKAFERVLAMHAQDRLSQIYIDRCLHFQHNPPPAAWDGVWVMTSK